MVFIQVSGDGALEPLERVCTSLYMMGKSPTRFNIEPMSDDIPEPTPQRRLTPAAQRALAEAEARRANEKQQSRPREIGGPQGPEPTRYGDWEVKGRASDF